MKTLSHSLALAALCAVVGSGVATAQTGVSDDRVNLPEGPGSLDGIGDNAEVDPNMALMRYSVPVRLPDGFGGTTPSLALAYNSGSGSGPVGIGWSLDLPAIERTSVYGLPEYDLDDEFATASGEFLVRVAPGNPATYRARFERGFVRYRWHDQDGGGGGFWTAESPDGTISYFGADRDQNPIETSRLTGPGGVFRYHLVDTVDPLGHHAHYEYEQLGTALLISSIEYAFVDGAPLFEVAFEYEARPDFLSDCRPGFNSRLEHRLASVAVVAEGVEMRRYAIEYEDSASSGGFSRVARVVTLGVGGAEYPIDFTFDYSQALGATCTGDGCSAPYLVNMGSLGVDVAAGTGTLADLNGDALPDFVNTAESGAHEIFFNRLIPTDDGSFEHRFDGPVASGVGTGSAFGLRSPYVQVLDVNGDGFSDLLNAQSAQVLPNYGGGDWGEPYALVPGTVDDLPDFGDEFTFGDNELAHVRFIDFDSDRRIDVIKAETESETTVYRNTGDGAFLQATGVGVIGTTFAAGLELADVNGDGLQDPTRVLDGEVSWKLNLGRGRWSSGWIAATGSPSFTETELAQVELDDLNGDALDDLVLVSGQSVRYWLNRAGTGFDTERVLDGRTIAGIPERTSSTTVLLADMNGNGSSDVVWIDASGSVTYLEIFPLRPNLLTRIASGIGLVTEVTYGTSVEHLSRDGGAEAWPNRLPFPMNVVDAIDTYDLLNEERGVTRYTYHDGFYDGVEKQFRGYAEVEVTSDGDLYQEQSLNIERYWVGDEDPYFNGLLRSSESYAVVDGERQPLTASTMTYDDCAVAGVPSTGLARPVRYICAVATDDIAQERAPEDAWVTQRSETDYDGYGNIVATRMLGVTAIGGGACAPCSRPEGVFGAPCGADCSGDEMYTWAEFVDPTENDDRWMPAAEVWERASASPGAEEFTERRTFYDGPAFVGLGQGAIERGLVRRVAERDRDGVFVDVERYDHDEHGNIIEAIGPRGSPTSRVDRRLYRWERGLYTTQVDILLTDRAGLPLTLRHEIEVHPQWQQPTVATGWYIAEQEDGRSDGVSRFEYDAFGRLSARALPGDDLSAPTEAYTYVLQSPSSQVITRRSLTSGGPLELETIQCLDGFGRTYQTRERLAEGRYLVSGHRLYNRNGAEVRTWQPWEDPSDACTTVPPLDVLTSFNSYDATGRLVYSELPPAEVGGAPARVTAEYLPLGVIESNEQDTDTSDANRSTPTVRSVDGLDRLVALERIGNDGQSLRYDYGYDVFGNPSWARDPEGIEFSQSASPRGLVEWVDDPHRGRRSFEHDAAGNIVSETDARGVTVRYEYDGADRRTAQWDDADREATLIEWFFDRAPGCDPGVCSEGAGLPVATSFPMDGQRVFERLGYSNRNEPTYVSRDIGGHRYEFASEYDNAGRLVREAMPGGVEVEYERDGFGRLLSVPGFIDRIDYDDRGLIAEMEAGNGVLTAYTHDGRMRMTGLSTWDATSAAILDYGIERDAIGQVTELVDNLALANAPSANAVFTYDGFDRLVSAELDAGRGEFAERLDWTWTRGGNLGARVSSRGDQSDVHAPTIAYGGLGASPYAMTSYNGMTFEYDAAGNVSRRGDQVLEWDAFGRLVAVTGTEGLQGEYAYDANDLRALKVEGGRRTLYFTDRFEVRDGVATVYLDIDGQRYARLETAALAPTILSDLAPLVGATPDPDAMISAGDAWVANAVSTGVIELADGVPSEVRELLASSAHRLLLGADGEAYSYFHHNHLGSVAAVTDEQGTVTERNDFFPEGQVRTSGARAPETFGYVGKEHDATGFIYFGARYLDPETGRWLSPDPAFDFINGDFQARHEEATSPYTNGRCNPTNFRDADGRFIDMIVGAVIGGLGGAIVAGVSEAVNQWRQVKSGSRDKINWRRVFWKSAVSGAAGALVGASGAAGLAMIAVSVGVQAVVSATTTGLRWKAENAAAIVRSPTASVAAKEAALNTYTNYSRAATVVSIGAAVVGLAAGGATVAASLGASVPMVAIANSHGVATTALQSSGIATTVSGTVAGVTTDSTRRAADSDIVRPRRARGGTIFAKGTRPTSARSAARITARFRAARAASTAARAPAAAR